MQIKVYIILLKNNKPNSREQISRAKISNENQKRLSTIKSEALIKDHFYSMSEELYPPTTSALNPNSKMQSGH